MKICRAQRQRKKRNEEILNRAVGWSAARFKGQPTTIPLRPKTLGTESQKRRRRRGRMVPIKPRMESEEKRREDETRHCFFLLPTPEFESWD